METFTKDHWGPGESAAFEYHCFESDASADADLWHRSHQTVTVVRHDPTDHECLARWVAEDAAYGTLQGRGDAAQPCMYIVRFEDGHEAGVFEDELMTDPAGFFRPAPPKEA